MSWLRGGKREMIFQERTCNACGWVHFGVSREYAEGEVKKFNAFYDKADAETKASYGNKRSSIGNYEVCMRCGGPWTNFRDSKPDDCPRGCTLNPIIIEDR